MVVKNIVNILSDFLSAKVLLVGDYMVDKYTKGTIGRISPEAPVGVLHVKSEHSLPGGAGNVVLNLLKLKARVSIAGRIGPDEVGEKLVSDLSSAGADVDGLVIQKNYCTPIKNRFIASGQQLLRVDREDVSLLPKDLEEKFLSKIPAFVNDKKIIAVSDYGKGFLTDRILKTLIEKAGDIPVIIDPKGNDFSKYKNAFMIKPNLSEAYIASKLSKKESLENVAEELFNITKVKKLLITRSEDGITLFDDKMNRKDFPVKSKEVQDVTGAGDTVLAVLAACMANNCSLEDSIYLANVAASIAIEHLGCARVSFSDLIGRVLELSGDNKVFEEDHLFAFKEYLENHKCIFVNLDAKKGLTAEIFQRMLKFSERKEKLLVYVTNPDDKFISMLSSLKFIDYIVVQKKTFQNFCAKVSSKEVFEIA